MINERLAQLREQMKADGLDAVIFPSNDPHQSEYVSDYWKVRAFFSGFTGSAGTLVVTQNEAALWTDSRYFLQFDQECSASEVKLYKQQIPHAPEHIPWLSSELQNGAIIGLDYRVFSCGMIDYIEGFTHEAGIQLKDTPHLVDGLWSNRPAGGESPIYDHPVQYCGESRESKLDRVRTTLNNEDLDYLLVSGLDEIAWLFNIRSADVDFTPLVTAYALVGREKTYLFADERRFNFEFNSSEIQLEPYDQIIAKLEVLTPGKTVLTDKNTLNYACFAAIKGDITYQDSAIRNWKSIKNSVEIENAKNGMHKDGVALTKFLMWLENQLQSNNISEHDLGRKLESFRKDQDLYVGESFPAIVGYKGNGAIIHYTAPENGSATITNEGVLLIDSGAQYLNATTDITRTLWLGGTPSEELKRAYTLVLKGHIALDSLKFPSSLTGMQLDSFARMHLWQHGLNYGHGTGHGIGSFSMVHEPGQGFTASGTTSRGTLAHQPSQFTTIEPGFYKKDAFGIRIENIVLSKMVEENEYGTFLGFEAITLCPIGTQLIDFKLFSDEERNWLNEYHTFVYQELSPFLEETERNWLKKQCEVV